MIGKPGDGPPGRDRETIRRLLRERFVLWQKAAFFRNLIPKILIPKVVPRLAFCVSFLGDHNLAFLRTFSRLVFENPGFHPRPSFG